MYPRLLGADQKQSLFLFGPRGVGKTAWLRTEFPQALYFDLPEHHVFARLLAAPEVCAWGRDADMVAGQKSTALIRDRVRKWMLKFGVQMPAEPSFCSSGCDPALLSFH
jgi:hypothetical protein